MFIDISILYHINLSNNIFMNFLKNKTILITGGTGSFGSSFAKELLKNKYNIKKIIIFSRDELKQFELQKKFQNNAKKLRFLLGDIRDKERLLYAFKNVDIVIHAAALKQVPAAEYNPLEFIKTNVLGSQNVIEACINANVKKIIALSTDKAVSPLNLYGATKLCADKLFVSANNIIGNQDISFSIVRYGNVLGSRGSILHEFAKQNKNKLKFNITDMEMTRFNILMKDAIDLVTWSVNNLKGGEIVIPKLKSFRIRDLAKSFNINAKFNVIGVRPGEKIHEELMGKADGFETFELRDKYLIISNQLINNKYKNSKLKKIKRYFSYNSLENDFLSINEIKNLIKKNFGDLLS
jgi:UDP-N-acetylglucosamine 4,6-dehydratase